MIFRKTSPPPQQKRWVETREYRIFKEEERFSTLPRTIYEKACRFSERLNIKTDAKTEKKLQDAINFSHLKVTPKGVASLTILFALITCASILILMITTFLFPIQDPLTKKMLGGLIPFKDESGKIIGGFNGISPGYGFILLMLFLFFVYYLYSYPFRLKKIYEMETGSEIVTLILYIAMYMRNVPSLEDAIRFSAENLTGPLAYEMRKMLWDIEVGNYLNIDDALADYTKRWSKNREFVEAVQLITTSMRQTGERRLTMLDEAVTTILQGNRENAKHFSQNLKTPVSVIHAMGIILPVLGLVLFPLVAIFLGVGPFALFFLYDIILPIILFFIITGVLETRPSTFSVIDISDNPDVPKPNMFAINTKKGKTDVPAWPFALIVGIAISGLGFLLMPTPSHKENELLSAILITGGIVFGFATYYLLLTFQRLGIRERTREIEKEFAEAIFQLGNNLYGGMPVELSLEHSIKRAENLKIKEMFLRAMNNMKTLGLTFRDAFFHREYGAVRYYPSKLIKSVMRTVVEASQKGVRVAAVALLSVSHYLRDIHQTQEQINDELNDPINSMKFQVYFLSPLISGVVVTLTIIMLSIIETLVTKISNMPIRTFLDQMSNVPISSFQFVLIVSVYLIETCFILSMFINGVENGKDDLGRQRTTAMALIFGFIVFVVVMFLTLAIFSPIIFSVFG